MDPLEDTLMAPSTGEQVCVRRGHDAQKMLSVRHGLTGEASAKTWQPGQGETPQQCVMEIFKQ